MNVGLKQVDNRVWKVVPKLFVDKDNNPLDVPLNKVLKDLGFTVVFHHGTLAYEHYTPYDYFSVLPSDNKWSLHQATMVTHGCDLNTFEARYNDETVFTMNLFEGTLPETTYHNMKTKGWTQWKSNKSVLEFVQQYKSSEQ